MAKANDLLYRTIPKRQPKSYVVLDIETDGLGGDFICAAIAYKDEAGQLQWELFERMEDVFDKMTSHWGRRYDWYAHNGMGYDYKYFLSIKEHVFRKNWNLDVLSSGSQDIGLKITQGHKTINLKDFYRIAPAKLETLTQKLDVRHKKLSGSINWATTRFNPENSKHLRYLQHDVFGLYEVIEKFTAIWDSYFGTPLGWTTPSSAMKAWKATIPEGHVYFRHRPEVRDFIREGYYGGMVRVHINRATKRWLKRQGAKILGWDVNSMYPAMMKEGVPVGTPIYTTQYLPEKPGFYRIKATVPQNTHYTILPLRDKEGTKFPTGEFETTATNLEINFARQLGHTVEVIEGYYFEKTEQIFNEFIGICESIRHNPDYKGTAIEYIAKLAQNSLYGKFGAKESGIHLRIQDSDWADVHEDSAMWTPYTDPQTGLPVEDVYEQDVEIDEPYLHPEWAAWITAKARIHLSQVAEPAARMGNLVYTDTDSVKIIIKPGDADVYVDEDPLRYGAWKREVEADEWQCAGPKTYMFHEPKKKHPYTIHAKGIPTKLVHVDDIRQAAMGRTMSVKYTQLSSFSALTKKGRMIAPIETTRTITTPGRVLGWRLEGNCFKPVHVDPALRQEREETLYEQMMRREDQKTVMLFLKNSWISVSKSWKGSSGRSDKRMPISSALSAIES